MMRHKCETEPSAYCNSAIIAHTHTHLPQSLVASMGRDTTFVRHLPRGQTVEKTEDRHIAAASSLLSHIPWELPSNQRQTILMGLISCCDDTREYIALDVFLAAVNCMHE